MNLEGALDWKLVSASVIIAINLTSSYRVLYNTGALCNLTLGDGAQAAVLNAGGIEALVMMLRAENEEGQISAMKSLQNMCEGRYETNVSQACTTSVRPLVEMLWKDSTDEKASCHRQLLD